MKKLGGIILKKWTKLIKGSNAVGKTLPFWLMEPQKPEGLILESSPFSGKCTSLQMHCEYVSSVDQGQMGLWRREVFK